MRLVCCRAMRGKEARNKCPELQLVQVPLTHGKSRAGALQGCRKAGGTTVIPALHRHHAHQQVTGDGRTSRVNNAQGEDMAFEAAVLVLSGQWSAQVA